jgi:hypothetical protein
MHPFEPNSGRFLDEGQSHPTPTPKPIPFHSIPSILTPNALNSLTKRHLAAHLIVIVRGVEVLVLVLVLVVHRVVALALGLLGGLGEVDILAARAPPAGDDVF